MKTKLWFEDGFCVNFKSCVLLMLVLSNVVLQALWAYLSSQIKSHSTVPNTWNIFKETWQSIVPVCDTSVSCRSHTFFCIN
jgi:hypothetical protein